MYIIKGIKFKNKSEVYKYFKLDRKNIEKKIACKNISFEEAVLSVLENREKKSKNSFTLEGVKYSNLHKACKVYNISYATIYRRIYEWGYSIEEAFLTPIKKSKPSKKVGTERILLQGINFPSLDVLCSKFKVKKSDIEIYLSAGAGLESTLNLLLSLDCRSFEYEIKRLKACFYELFGIYYVNFTDACTVLKVSKSGVRMRIARGSSKEDSFKYFMDLKDRYIIGDAIFKSKEEAFRITEVSRRRAEYALNKGLSREEAFKLREGDTYSIGYLEYNGFFEACEKLAIDKNAVIESIRSGFSKEDAFYNVYFGKGLFFVNDMEFSSFDEACIKYNKNKDEVFIKIIQGWSREEALGLVPRGYRDVKGLKVEKPMPNGYYRCTHNNRIKYYSKEELLSLSDSSLI